MPPTIGLMGLVPAIEPSPQPIQTSVEMGEMGDAGW